MAQCTSAISVCKSSNQQGVKKVQKAVSTISLRKKEAEMQFVINQYKGRVKTMEDQIKQKDTCIKE